MRQISPIKCLLYRVAIAGRFGMLLDIMPATIVIRRGEEQTELLKIWNRARSLVYHLESHTRVMVERKYNQINEDWLTEQAIEGLQGWLDIAKKNISKIMSLPVWNEAKSRVTIYVMSQGKTIQEIVTEHAKQDDWVIWQDPHEFDISEKELEFIQVMRVLEVLSELADMAVMWASNLAVEIRHAVR